MHTSDEPQPLPRILCLHGGGTSATIFYMQTVKLRRALGGHFQFVFADAPIESAPGPGVLPVFDGCEPFWRWVERREGMTKEGWLAEEKHVDAALERAIAATGDEAHSAPVVGVLGFSQGAGIATELLLRQQRPGNTPSRWADLQFGVLLSGISPPWRRLGGDGERVQLPTVHTHGRKDPWLTNGQALLTDWFEPSAAELMSFHGGHHLPTSVGDNEQLAEMILRAASRVTENERKVKEISKSELGTTLHV